LDGVCPRHADTYDHSLTHTHGYDPAPAAGYAHAHAHAHAYAHAHTHAYTHTHTYAHAYAHTHTHTHTHAYTHAYAHAYAHTHAHAHSHPHAKAGGHGRGGAPYWQRGPTGHKSHAGLTASVSGRSSGAGADRSQSISHCQAAI
jgi:hypothetical protein